MKKLLTHINADQAMSFVRGVLLKAGGGALVSHGIITSTNWTILVGIISTAVGQLWSQCVHQTPSAPTPTAAGIDPNANEKTAITTNTMKTTLSIGLALLGAALLPGCSTLNLTTGEEITTIQGIQAAGDFAAGGGIAYATYIGNQPLVVAIQGDENALDAACQSGIAALTAGTNATSFTVLESQVSALLGDVLKTVALAESNSVPAVTATAKIRASVAKTQAGLARLKAVKK